MKVFRKFGSQLVSLLEIGSNLLKFGNQKDYLKCCIKVLMLTKSGLRVSLKFLEFHSPLPPSSFFLVFPKLTVQIYPAEYHMAKFSINRNGERNIICVNEYLVKQLSNHKFVRFVNFTNFGPSNYLSSISSFRQGVFDESQALFLRMV